MLPPVNARDQLFADFAIRGAARQQVLDYAQPATAKGFVYMDTPGYDPVSATGQVAGGANMICFTTGRGSAYGCKPATWPVAETGS